MKQKRKENRFLLYTTCISRFAGENLTRWFLKVWGSSDIEIILNSPTRGQCWASQDVHVSSSLLRLLGKAPSVWGHWGGPTQPHTYCSDHCPFHNTVHSHIQFIVVCIACIWKETDNQNVKCPSRLVLYPYWWSVDVLHPKSNPH